ncbi:MAG: 50S ribosomal protein L28 [Omnitrophica WOR_2 bacterium RIFCSPLOWO2_12_FULL_50_9]|nr:MAG: 50S ribosomal protein L28 [Omnitrophica WOR_2 bacterium RIFCSPHIGHO2_02_FULL_50_17]OGX41426.1 MAG: 50S ribosomal protein L28 [Omnitrophica WOR_2 bacterium RIFCSPLOWO2_12_FULL_50_9]
MGKACVICNKSAIPGAKYKRRGQIKRTGGAGSKIVGKSLRRFLPNLQRIKINLQGTVRRVYVCTSCISAGKILKA